MTFKKEEVYRTRYEKITKQLELHYLDTLKVGTITNEFTVP
ncbi:hypothetical protein ABFY60_07595 [Lysinibacillus pakistanensis]